MEPPISSVGIASGFLHDGFVHLTLFDTQACARLTEVWRNFAARHSGGFASTLLINDAALRADVHRALLPDVEAAMAAALPSYRVVFCGFVNKAPGSATLMPLHQDITMTDENRRPAISLWAPLVDVDTANGCLMIVPGSHRLNAAPRAPGTPFAAAPLESELHRRYVQPLELAAGDAALMDQRLFHASGRNEAACARPVVAAVLVPCDQSLLYYHRTPAEPIAELEGFEVPDDFFLEHQLGQRPASGRSLGSIPEAAEPISLARLTEVLDRDRGSPATRGMH